MYASLRTGDLLLFSDRYWITSNLTRVCTRSPWTHAAVVVRVPWVPVREDDVLMWELANGVFPLFDHVTGTIRRNGARLVSLREKLKFFPNYKNRVMVMRLQRRWRRQQQQVCYGWSMKPSSLIDKDDHLEQWVFDHLWPLLQKWSRVLFRHDLWVFIKAAFAPKPWHHKRQASDVQQIALLDGQHLRHRRMFCTEALAILYQYLGVIDARYNPQRFVPGDFLAPQILKDGWVFEPWLSVRLS